MARLPVYTSQGSITTGLSARLIPKGENSQNLRALSTTGDKISSLALQWQKAKDEVENLDGKNKLLSGMSEILSQAQDYNDYSTPDELTKKQSELITRMESLTPEIISGFSNNKNAQQFKMQAQLTTMQNVERLKGIFRDKYTDMAKSNLMISQDSNRNDFITTGNENYKKSYFNDIDSMVNAGFIDRQTAQGLKLETDKWDVYHVLRIAESNPEEVIRNIKTGKYNIKDEDKHDLLQELSSMKTNKQLLQEYENSVRQDNNEGQALAYIYSNRSYADKLQYIDEQELAGNISSNMAAKLRRGIRSQKPGNQKSASNSQAINDIIQQAYDLNENIIDNKEFLKGSKNLRNKVLQLQSEGLITAKDANTLNSKINQVTRSRLSEATNAVSFSSEWKDARAYINDSLPPEMRSQAVRNVFYSATNVNTENMKPKEVRAYYKNQAIEEVQAIKQGNREKALQTKAAPKNKTVNTGLAIP